MIPRKSLTPFLADTSQIPSKKLAQLWLANPAGAGKAGLKHELQPPYPVPAPFFFALFLLGASLRGTDGEVGRGRAGSSVPGFSRVRTGLIQLRRTGRIRDIDKNWAQAKRLGMGSGEAVTGAAAALRTAPVEAAILQGKGGPVLKSRLASRSGAMAKFFIPVKLPGAL